MSAMTKALRGRPAEQPRLRTIARGLVLVALACATAYAEPAQSRVVLADPDPELARALTTALAPWHLEVVVDANTPVDENQAQARADTGAARFVVWRKHRDLVVFDRDSGIAEHRDAPDGALDPVSAAAAALTVKTLMRLPPPPDENPAPPPPATANAAVVAPPAPEETPALRVQAGLATRIARGSDTDIGARIAGAVMVRAFATVHVGVTGDAGTATDVDRAGFKGTWRDWSLAALGSWTHAFDRWELEPHVAAGFTRATLSGEEMGIARTDRGVVAIARGGVWLRWRYDMWTVGGMLEVERAFGTPTYTRTNTNVEIFSAPASSVLLGLVIAADFGR
jgi:hypothetical protein